MAESVTVTRTIELEAPLADVWDAVTTPEDLGAWLGGSVSIDVRPGGTGRMDLPDGERSVLVTRVEPAQQVSWLWWGSDGEVSSVDVSLVSSGSTTVLTVVERAALSSGVPQASALGRWMGRFRIGAPVRA